MRHLSAWAAAFLFFAGFFLAFFDFWDDTPGPEFRGNSRERGPRSPRNRAREFDPPLGARAVWPGGRGAGAAGPGRGRHAFFSRGRGGGGPAGARRARGAAAASRRAKAGGAGRRRGEKRGGACAGTGGLRRARARRAGGCPAAGRAGQRGGTRGQIRRAAAGRGGPGAGGKSAGRVGRGAGFLGRGAGFFGAAPIFGGGGRKNPRFCFIRKRGFSPAFLCRIRADFSRKPCAFHRVAFSARRSDECVAAGKKAKTKSRRGREKNRRAKREGTP